MLDIIGVRGFQESGFKVRTGLRDGLNNTVNAYNETLRNL